MRKARSDLRPGDLVYRVETCLDEPFTTEDAEKSIATYVVVRQVLNYGNPGQKESIAVVCVSFNCTETAGLWPVKDTEAVTPETAMADEIDDLRRWEHTYKRAAQMCERWVKEQAEDMQRDQP